MGIYNVAAGQTTSAALFKVVYGAQKTALREIFPAMELIKDQQKDLIGGKYFDFPVFLQADGGVGPRAENDTLPASTSDVDVSARVYPRFNYGRFTLTGPEIALSKNQAAAFANLLKQKQMRTYTNVLRSMARQFYGDGTDILAATDTGAGGAVTSLNVFAGGNRIDGAGNAITNGTKYFRRNQPIVIIEVVRATGVFVAYRGFTTVRAISQPSTLTVDSFVLGANSDAVNNALVIVTGSAAVAGNEGHGHALWGLGAAVSDLDPGGATAGTNRWGYVGANPAFADAELSTASMYMGIPRVTGATPREEWKSKVKDNGGVQKALDPNLSDMHEICRRVWEGTGSKISHIFLPGPVFEEYAAALGPQVQYEPVKIIAGWDKGFPAFYHEGLIPMIQDPEAPNNSMQFVTLQEMLWLVNHPLDWVTIGGDVLVRVANTDNYEAVCKFYGNLATGLSSAHGRLDDILTTTNQDQ